MLKDKLLLIYGKYSENYNEILTKWNDFLTDQTYLTFEKKEQFLQEISDIKTFPWFYKLIVLFSSKSKKLKNKVKILEKEIKKYNSEFVTSRLKEYNRFFDGTDFGIKYPLDEDQRITVVKDDKHNLIVAGAGSGKTSVITSRIAYLVNREDKIDKERILALAFTRVAAEEMEKRILKNYGIDIDIYTFHALGRKIIEEETGHKPKLLFNGSPSKKFELIDQIYSKLLQDQSFQKKMIKYVSYYIDEEVPEEHFVGKQEYFAYMRNKSYTTFNNLIVKSIAEKNIANFLFLNQINFEYEPLVEWVDKNKKGENDGEGETSKENEAENKEKEYHPDFYLPEYDIYIEHWGLNRNYQVPEWFTKTSEDYVELREWKLEQFEKHQKNLIETWDYERKEGTLILNLKKNLKLLDPSINFNSLSYNELVERVYDFKDNVDEIRKLTASFIRIAKSNFLLPEDISNKVEDKKITKKQRLFGKIALEVYNEYETYLRKEDVIDFNDMINLAVQFMKVNPQKYLNRYDHVLVDEFQDISHQRVELVKGFVNENSDTKLFCVGDDWQSIYQFTGSDVSYFIDFEDHFPHPEVSYLERNYRSTPQIVQMSNALISYNKYQITKKAKAMAEFDSKPFLFTFSKHLAVDSKIPLEALYNLIDKLVTEGVDPEDIMVLARFNKRIYELEIKCGARGLETKEKRGSSKKGG